MFELNDSERQLVRDLEALAASLPREAPARVQARLSAELSRRKRRWRIPVAVAAAAAAVALLLPLRHSDSPVPALSTFLMLDNQPINAGLVVRMKLPASIFGGASDAPQVEADVLL
jgi:anti-sigma-K factor RskA